MIDLQQIALKSVFKAVKGESPANHEHVIYIRPDGTGATSKDSGHSHQVVKQEDGSIKVWYEKEHTHLVDKLKFTEVKEEQLKEKDELDLCYQLYKTATELEKKAVKDGESSEKFYRGEQWSKSDIDKLKNEDRPALTINETKPKIDLIVGYQKRNRTDIKLLPNETGDAHTADIYNARIKNICENSNYLYEESEWFEDAVKVGRGCINVRVVPSRRGIGEVEIRRKHWKKCFWGAHEKKDGSDATYCGFWDQVEKDKLKELYPDKAEDIQRDFDLVSGKDTYIVPRNKSDYYKDEAIQISADGPRDKSLVDIAKKEYKLIEIQRKKFFKVPLFINEKHNFNFSALGLSEKEIESFKTIEELNFLEDLNFDVYISVFAGNVLLKREKSFLHYLSLVPVYCNKDENYFWGKVHDVKDCQKEINKRHSQLVDIVNKMASYAVGVSSEAFDSTKDFNDFVENRNRPGFVAKLKPGFKDQIYEFQGIKYPQEVAAVSEINSEKMATIMNVYPEMMGTSDYANSSGVALARKMQQGWMGNEYIFDNLSQSKRQLAKVIIDAIQYVDSPEKILRIIESNGNKQYTSTPSNELYPKLPPEKLIQLGQQVGIIKEQDMMLIAQSMHSGQGLPPEIQQILEKIQELSNQNRREDLLNALKNFELVDYDIVVSESTYTPTMMFSNYVILSDLFKGNPNAPYQELIKLIPYLSQDIKDSIIAQMNAQAQAAADQERMKSDTEIKKVLLANQAKLQQSGVTG